MVKSLSLALLLYKISSTHATVICDSSVADLGCYQDNKDGVSRVLEYGPYDLDGGVTIEGNNLFWIYILLFHIVSFLLSLFFLDFNCIFKTIIHILGCMQRCYAFKLRYSGVEFGNQCFCGDELQAPLVQADASNCETVPCGGDNSTMCGGTNYVHILNTSCSGQVIPNYFGCQDNVSKALP